MTLLSHDQSLKQHLILGAKIRGTPVFDEAGERIGRIDDVAIESVHGDMTYAIVASGGFYGVGEKYRPLPWDSMTYDGKLGGFVVALDKDALESGPSYNLDDLSHMGVEDRDDRAQP